MSDMIARGMAGKALRDCQQIVNDTNDIFLQNTLLVFGHRGAKGIAPENTIPAIEKAKEYGFLGVELDVRTTSDGVLVVLHDETVDAMTDGTGNVSEITYANLQAMTIDAGSNIGLYTGLNVPTLDAALQKIADLKLYAMLHVYAANESDLIGLISKYRLSDYIIVSSYDTDYLTGIRAISGIMLSKISYNITNDIAAVKTLGNCLMASSWGNFTESEVDLAHDNGLYVVTDTCTSLTTFQTIKAYGVDMILSDVVCGDNGKFIFDKGENANGSWIKYSDGTMTCWGRRTFSNVPVTSASGSGFYSPYTNTVMGNYPVAFSAVPQLLITCNAQNNYAWCTPVTAGTGSVMPEINTFRFTSGTITTLLIEWVANGTWAQI